MCRPLPRPALEYAATDVHYLLHIAALLAVQLQNRPPKSAAAGTAAQPSACGEPASSEGLQEDDHVFTCADSSGDSDSGDAGGCRSAPSPQLLQAAARSHRVTARLYTKPQHDAAALAAAHAVLRRFSPAVRQKPQLQHIASRDDEARQPSRVGCHAPASPDWADNVNGVSAASAPGRDAAPTPGQAPFKEGAAGCVHIGGASRDCIYGLCLWRDSTARKLDEGALIPMSPLSAHSYTPGWCGPS